MGTSSSYSGPVGVSGLLPPWADEPTTADHEPGVPAPSADEADVPPSQQPPPNDAGELRPVRWSSPKSTLSRIARGTSAPRYERVMGSYVRAAGGSRGATHAAAAGRRTAAGLGRFLSAVANSGVAEAARALGIESFVGRSAQALLADLVDLLAPAGALLEEAAARRALIGTVDDLFREFDIENNGLAALDAMDRAAVERTMLRSVANYVHERWQQQLVVCIERGTVSEREANTMIGEVKDFIVQTVTFDFRDVDVLGIDWRGPQGRALVERVYRAAYSLLSPS